MKNFLKDWKKIQILMPVTFDADKKRFYEMKKLDQKSDCWKIISEILKRFDKKIKDPRSFDDGKKIVKIIKSFLKINCKLSELDKKLLNFAKKNNLKKIYLKNLNQSLNLKKLNQDINFIVKFWKRYRILYRNCV